MPANPKEEKISYVSRDDVPETFCDYLQFVRAEHGVMHLEFSVLRLSAPTAPTAAPAPRRVTAVRLAMPVPTLVDLHNRLTAIIATLEKQQAPKTAIQ